MDKEKTKKQSSRRRNQKLHGFKKDSECCISSILTGLDEIEAAIGFLFKVSEVECESLIKAGKSTQDQKHARSKQGGFLDKMIPSQELQQCCILLNAH